VGKNVVRFGNKKKRKKGGTTPPPCQLGSGKEADPALLSLNKKKRGSRGRKLLKKEGKGKTAV